MGRISVFLIVMALIAGMAGCSGGTNPDPYANYIKIYNWADLDNIRNSMVAKHVLMNDLDSSAIGYHEVAGPTANEGKGWKPIGGQDDRFAGTFDGQGYEICDLSTNRTGEDFIGLFGFVAAAGVLKDIGLLNVAVTGSTWVGALTAWNEGYVNNCYSVGNVTAVADEPGGLIAHNKGTVSNCCFIGNVTGDWDVGGLVGINEGTLSDCYASANVIGNSRVGGLVAVNEGTVTNSHSTGSVTGDMGVGGLVGDDGSTGTVSNSFWDTETSGQATSDGGTGRNTTEMRDIATFSGVGWDIVEVANFGIRNLAYIWNIVDDETYPFLSWQPVS